MNRSRKSIREHGWAMTGCHSSWQRTKRNRHRRCRPLDVADAWEEKREGNSQSNMHWEGLYNRQRMVESFGSDENEYCVRWSRWSSFDCNTAVPVLHGCAVCIHLSQWSLHTIASRTRLLPSNQLVRSVWSTVSSTAPHRTVEQHGDTGHRSNWVRLFNWVDGPIYLVWPDYICGVCENTTASFSLPCSMQQHSLISPSNQMHILSR